MITITVKKESCIRQISAPKGSLLLSVLQEHGIEQEAPCGGKGICGSCKITTSLGDVLACQHKLNEDITIFYSERKPFQSILMKSELSRSERLYQESGQQKYGIAIDIGTTTLGFALKDLKTQKMIAQWGCTNSQRQYGADVASRIAACEQPDNLKKLSACVRNDIKMGIDALLKQANVNQTDIQQIIIVGNAVMLHILQQISPLSIGKAPFLVPEPSIRKYNQGNIEVILFPHAGAFIGGDIVSGVEYLQMSKSDHIYMLIDLGTNGEMVIGNRRRMISAAAAAGPAFENCFRSTGTTGSKALDLLVLNAKRRVLARDGLLKPQYRERGIPCGPGLWITQSQIREIQLAKGAIRTGIDLLVEMYGCQMSDIEQVYLAGGFGFYLNILSAIRIGLLPEEFQHKITVSGNTALSGAFAALGNESMIEEAERIRQQIECYNLAEIPNFQEKYLKEISYILK